MASPARPTPLNHPHRYSAIRTLPQPRRPHQRLVDPCLVSPALTTRRPEGHHYSAEVRQLVNRPAVSLSVNLQLPLRLHPLHLPHQPQAVLSLSAAVAAATTITRARQPMAPPHLRLNHRCLVDSVNRLLLPPPLPYQDSVRLLLQLRPVLEVVCLVPSQRRPIRRRVEVVPRRRRQELDCLVKNQPNLLPEGDCLVTQVRVARQRRQLPRPLADSRLVTSQQHLRHPPQPRHNLKPLCSATMPLVVREPQRLPRLHRHQAECSEEVVVCLATSQPRKRRMTPQNKCVPDTPVEVTIADISARCSRGSQGKRGFLIRIYNASDIYTDRTYSLIH